MKKNHKHKANGNGRTEVRSRSISRQAENELWARSAGRCELEGCNKPLFKSPLSQEPVNIGEKAHIWSFSPDGPRGAGPYVKSRSLINEQSNLLLACGDCHKLIDTDKAGVRYSAEVLQRSKQDHERRIAINTGVDPEKRSHAIIYAANISDQTSTIRQNDAHSAMFPDRYPADERPVRLSMSWEGRDRDPDYWKTEATNLRAAYTKFVQPLIDEGKCSHFSVFPLAPIPLITLLGTLFTDKANVQAYQLHREPEQTWRWLDDPSDLHFQLKAPKSSIHPPALVLSLSDHISYDRITSVLGKDVSIWELTVATPGNDFLRSRVHLKAFREALRDAMVLIGKEHGHATPLNIFPAIPVACALEFGRIRMPKAQMPWVIYDQSNTHGKFIQALSIF